ncbi:response regulator, partial [Gillisia sp. Q332]|uniref:response regulator n=1 Tax=Gillisia xinjiangensis TaxID=3384765 RepID=UPI00391DA789
ILVVGESAAPGSVLRHILLTEGYSETQCVPSAREAFGMLAETTPDLVIVDVAGHDADGFDLLRTLSRRAQEQILPVLVACDGAELMTRLQVLEASTLVIIGKPLERFLVAFKVRNLLHTRRLFEELRQSKLAVERQFLERTTKLNHALDLLTKAERELAKRLAESQNESRGKSAFVADIGHELRTPLNAILGFSEVIRDQRFGSVG